LLFIYSRIFRENEGSLSAKRVIETTCPMARKLNIKYPFHQFIIGFVYPFSALGNGGSIKHLKSMHLFNTLLVTGTDFKDLIETTVAL
jgi:hypothetical protein